MISAIIGILGSIGMVAGAFISTGSLHASFDMPALLIVVALALFSTLGVSGKLPRGALIRHFGDAAVRAGWIGFLIGVIILARWPTRHRLISSNIFFARWPSPH